MSVKYILSGVPLADQRLRLITKEAVPPYGAALYIYELTRAVPKIRLGDTENRPGASLRALMEEGGTFGAQTYLDCSSCARHAPRASDSATVVRQENGRVTVRTYTAGPRWLIIGESYLPGWSLTLDGAPVTAYLADGLYMAVEVPAGEHTVEALYNGVRNERALLEKLRIITP